MSLSFTLGSKTNEDLSIILRERPLVMLPGSESDEYSKLDLPGHIGSVATENELDGLVFKLKCQFTDAGDAIGLKNLIRQLNNHLTDDSGDTRTLPLSFPEEPSLFYSVVFSGPQLNADRVKKGDATFDLTLFAPDPRAKGPEETITKNITSSPFSFSVENSGNVETPTIIKIKNKGNSAASGINLKLEV